MKLLRYLTPRAQRPQLGLQHQGRIVSLEAIAHVEKSVPPGGMLALIEEPDLQARVQTWDQKFKAGDYQELSLPEAESKLLPPLEFALSFRDAYAFRQHVATARRNRGVEMIPEFDQYPVFYFTNPHTLVGPGELAFMPDHFQRLDYELEVAMVVGAEGRNLRAADADAHIFGYMLFNDWSARQLQLEEMKLNLGPAKGKDFANGIGPWLVTPDELEAHQTAPPAGHVGRAYNLGMRAFVNDKLLSEGNLSSMDWTFAEILERVSYGVTIRPGEVIGSGTVGTGCLLELNGTARHANASAADQWLQPGDTVRLEMDQLGVLANALILDPTAQDWSILDRKKNL